MDDTIQNQNQVTEQKVEESVTPEMPKEEKTKLPADERLLSALCYIPFLALLSSPLAVIKKPESKFCEFHASQGLVFFVVWFASLWVVGILNSLVIAGILWLVLLAVSVFGVFQAWSGSLFKVPFLAMIADHLPVKKLFVAVKKQAGVEVAPKEEAPVEGDFETSVSEAPASAAPVVPEEVVPETPVVAETPAPEVVSEAPVVAEAPVVEAPVSEVVPEASVAPAPPAPLETPVIPAPEAPKEEGTVQ